MRVLLCLTPWVLCLSFGTVRAGDLTVFFDIKPKACPNWFTPPHALVPEPVPTAVLGTEGLNARNIQPNSLLLILPGGGGVLGGGNTVIPIETLFKDVSRPVPDPTDCKCTDEGPDEFEDLVAKFDAKELADAIGPVSDGDEILACIQGLLLDGTPFQGCDCIKIKLGPVSVDEGSWGRTKATYR